MRVLCGHDEKEDRTNGYFIIREVHRLWDAGLLGLHPTELTMHVAEFPELKEQHQKYDSKRITVATNHRLQSQHFCKPPLLWWRWYRFLVASKERAVARTECPYFCILCHRGYQTLVGYQTHTTAKYALKKHKNVPASEWYGKACAAVVPVDDSTLPEYDPPKHTCVLCLQKYTGKHSCATCGGLCHQRRCGDCRGCPHKKGSHHNVPIPDDSGDSDSNSEDS
jgi:hypothetical protein